MIEVSSLVKDYGSHRAVNGVTFKVNQGDILGFLGPNGAGKSTTMKMITGFLRPTSGMVKVGGFDVAEHPVEVKKRIGYLPESSPAYSEMTVDEFLGFIAETRGFRTAEQKAERVGRVVKLCHLEGVRKQPIETLSKAFSHPAGFPQPFCHGLPCSILSDRPSDSMP